MTVLIPAYNPDERLIALVNQLTRLPYRILIVDDGSRADTRKVFLDCAAMGCIILRHESNQGKGTALKTGFRWIRENTVQEGVVCADADGQHLPEDIDAVAKGVLAQPGTVILGTRRFTGAVPWKSRFGNRVTRWVFHLASGHRVYDTQTGLRGYPHEFLDWLLQVKGSRFEYEMNLLLYAASNEIPTSEVEIHTIYQSHHTTHFHPVKDSVRVYKPILTFCASSLISAGVDFILLFILKALTGNLLASVIGARTISSALNYTLNRQYVFTQNNRGEKPKVARSLPRYALVAVAVMLINYGVIYAYSHWMAIPLVIAKILTEGTLYLFSYWLQRKFVFSRKKKTKVQSKETLQIKEIA